MSDEISTHTKIFEAVSNVMRDVGTLAKDDHNKHGGYNFAGIDKFLSVVGPKCAEHGLIIIQDEVGFETLETVKEGSGGQADKKTTWLRLEYEFTLAHSSGEVWDHKIKRNAMVMASMGAQAFGAAQSYALKQFMRSLFQIPTGDGEDSDNHEQSQLPAAKRTSKPEQDPDAGSKAYVAKVLKALLDTPDIAGVDNLKAEQKSSMKSLELRSPDLSNKLDDAFTARIEALEEI